MAAPYFDDEMEDLPLPEISDDPQALPAVAMAADVVPISSGEVRTVREVKVDLNTWNNPQQNQAACKFSFYFYV